MADSEKHSLESSLEKISDNDDEDDVVYEKGSDFERYLFQSTVKTQVHVLTQNVFFSRIDDVPPLDLHIIPNRGRFSRYKAAMKQMQPVKIFKGYKLHDTLVYRFKYCEIYIFADTKQQE